MVVYIDVDIYGRKFVREIIPDEARPVEDWYNVEFASHCMEVEDSIVVNMLYDADNKLFYSWVPFDEDTHFKTTGLLGEIQNTLDSI